VAFSKSSTNYRASCWNETCTDNAMQCVAVFCTMLHSVALCCTLLLKRSFYRKETCTDNVMECAAVCCSALHCVALFCTVLLDRASCQKETYRKCVTMCCSVLHYVALCCTVLLKRASCRKKICKDTACFVLQVRGSGRGGCGAPKPHV